MENSVYQVNKGINKSIEFKGLKAQYIWYLGAAAMALLIGYALLYFMGVNTYIGLAVILCAGGLIMLKVYAMSAKYGEHGLMKELARKGVPKLVKCNSRKVFRELGSGGKGRGMLHLTPRTGR